MDVATALFQPVLGVLTLATLAILGSRWMFGERRELDPTNDGG